MNRLYHFYHHHCNSWELCGARRASLRAAAAPRRARLPCGSDTDAWGGSIAPTCPSASGVGLGRPSDPGRGCCTRLGAPVGWRCQFLGESRTTSARSGQVPAWPGFSVGRTLTPGPTERERSCSTVRARLRRAH